MAFEEEYGIMVPNAKISPAVETEKQKSKDHKKEVKEEYTKLTTPYDIYIIKDILTQSNRFKNLNRTAISKILGERAKYGYSKRISLSLLHQNLRNQLDILSRVNENKVDKLTQSDEVTNDVSHGVFSWSWEVFVERRNQKSFLWVDILFRMQETKLHSLKYRIDLKELQLLLGHIIKGFVSAREIKNVDLHQTLGKPIADAQKALSTIDSLEKEFHANSKELQHLIYKEYLFSDAKRHSEEKMLKSYLENRICNSYIWDPIEVRYQLNWYNSVVNQNQYHNDKEIKTYQKDISHFKEMEKMESSIDGNCMDFCYSSIDLLKSRIAEIQNKFDNDFDEMENILAYKRLQIEKLKEQQIFLTSEIERFHEEEEKIRLEEEEKNI